MINIECKDLYIPVNTHCKRYFVTYSTKLLL